jgi:hypothetical protein
MRTPSTTASDFDSCRGGSAYARRAAFSPSAVAFTLSLLVVAIGIALLALTSASASAAYIHPTESMAFGKDGTSATTFESGLDALAYQQSSQRLYVLATGAQKIYGFSNPSPGTFTPIPGSFPISVPYGGGDPDIAVDNTSGSTAGRIYYLSESTGQVYGYTNAGAEITTGLPINPSGSKDLCGLAVDGAGNLLIGNYSTSKVLKYSPSGSLIAEIPVGFSVCQVAVDPITNDLYPAQYGGATYKFTAASNYTEKSGPIDNVTKASTVDKSGKLYIARYYYQNARIYDSSGALIETFGEGNNHTYSGIAVNEATGEIYLADQNSGGLVRVFPGVVVPDVTTGEPTGDKSVSGRVEPAGGGTVTECFFEYATDAYFTANHNYNQTQPCTPAPPFSEDKNVSAELSLEGEVLYHYRLVAANANGKNAGIDKTIEAHNVVALKTEAADNIDRTTARLNGSFEGTNEATKYWFEWESVTAGTPTEFDNQTTHEEEVPTTGPTPLHGNLSGLTAGVTYRYRVVAENSKGVSKANIVQFTTSPAIKDLQTDAATNVDTENATLNGTLDPDGYATTYYFEWGKDTSYGQATPLPPGTDVEPTTPGDQSVSAEITNLEAGTTYHFRIVAVNQFGTTRGADETVTTPQAPSITSFSATNITAESADLIATVNPNGYTTTYWFEYGLTPDYGTKVPVPPAQLPEPTGVQPIDEHITGLEERTYHFRLVAENEWGEVKTEDQTFDFNVPVGCPNQHQRQQTGAAYLPDCRAYELVSPAQAGGAALFPEGPLSPYADGKLAFSAFINGIPGAGESQNAEFFMKDLYIATRRQGDWGTKYVGVPGNEGLAVSSAPGGEYGGQDEFFNAQEGFNYPNAAPADATLSHILIWNRETKAYFGSRKTEGTNAPNVYDNEGRLLGKLPTNIDEVPGGDKGLKEEGWIGSARINPEYTHYLFSSIRAAFAPGGLTEEPGSAYDDNLKTGEVTLISKTESGADIPKDLSDGYNHEFIRIPAVSKDGSHILMMTGAPPFVYAYKYPYYAHLYLAVNQHDGTYKHYDISVNANGENVGVHFERMTEDGTKIFFTTDKQMTPDDTDSSIDLYVWNEATNSLTRVSDSGNLLGNSDSCSAGWTEKCSVEVIPYTMVDYNHRSTRFTDIPMASETGEIYFYSPEQLDGARGYPNKRNLYVYRNGKPQFVASFNEGQPVERINVSPDGSHMAMITKTQLTAYDNAGFSEMYLYDPDPAARTIKCVSCLPSGEKPTDNVEGAVNGWFMAFDGRIFFSTRDALVPQDANRAVDVYEFVNGRPQLISTGTGREGNAFQGLGLIGVSGDGVDVFFSTYETLVKQDENGDMYKFYDARTSGGFPPPVEVTPCAAADECHGEDTSLPAPPEVGSGARLGSGGNYHMGTGRKCKKHKGKCHHKKHPRHKRSRHHKRSNHG